MKYYIFVLTFALILASLIANGQDTITINKQTDSTLTANYYTNLNNQFILRFFTHYKANNVNITKGDTEIRYRPNGTFNVGIGFNWKFLGLGFSYGIPKSTASNNKYGKTQRFDFQASIMSKVFGGDGFLQIYRGYHIANPGDLTDWEEDYFPQLPDMQVITLGINAFYIVNHNRFSYRAAFVGNQIQHKSAGSVTAGLFGTFDQLRTDNGFIPPEFIDYDNEELDLKSFEALTVGLSVGYMYTFVLGKGFFISLAGVPGIGYRQYRLTQLNDTTSKDQRVAFHLLGRIAAGWNKYRYFLNLNTIFNVRNYRYEPYEISMSTEQLRLTFGIRFITKASKKRNQYYPEK
jgi:hypothetical protein